MEEERGESVSSFILHVRGISKGFPGVQALEDVDFALGHSEIHAVVGENGAGKTTLMNILSGVLQPDRGQIFLEGRQVSSANPREALDLGIGIVHQETSLCANLSIAENVFVHDIPKTWSGMVNFRRLYEQTEAVLQQFDIKASPKILVRELGIAQQQLVEIAKASAHQCKVLILDEPTSTLALHEAAILFDRVRQMKADGTSVIYISHRLREVFELADRVTILRDGHVVGTKVVSETNLAAIVSLMVGREISQFFPEKGKGSTKTVLQVRHLASGPKVREVSFDLHQGEILGVAGLVGAGRTEMALAVFGATPIDRGEIFVNGKQVHIGSPRRAIELGLGYLPEDRRLLGLFLGLH
ncbi:MAG: sugar ABC transporter ATP-binding protein, partial [Spirochaetia bacterium]